MKKKSNGTNKINQNITPDGLDVEYSAELADQEDMQAQERSAQADARVKKKQ
ncbi:MULTISPECIES: YfhD family protein [unclassified Bacillus (in: firmicutes)]|uniref:YfhD family protein n=1 Tax=unclassified Bacillus (in: firmicutes) TaxID=185979 RepID=UPI000BF0C63C|nr:MULTISPECIES: YfhD family protein [unclassified Bacillus (in: firmicutes)]PEJ57215.1 YfhD family protein [Bacillus sp. AFS002410]PEL12704.1 YfhD family protein [Bacillus sp. AFS017336]